VKVDLQSFDDWIKSLDAPPASSPDLIVSEIGSDSLHPSIPVPNYLTCDGSHSSFCDPKIDAMVKKALTTTDLDAQEQQWADTMAAIREQAPFVAVSVPALAAGTETGVQGVVYPLPQDIHWAEWSKQ
jgi:ABC-type transport system substrate-binding protein